MEEVVKATEAAPVPAAAAAPTPAPAPAAAPAPKKKAAAAAAAPTGGGGKPKALRIVSIDAETNQFALNEDALRTILLGKACAGLPAVVVSVAGTFAHAHSHS